MKHFKSERGYALLLTIILTTVISILGAALLLSLSSEIKMNRVMEERSITIYLAQAGIEHGLNVLENTPIGESPMVPIEPFKIYNQGNSIYEYEIIELSNSMVKSIGRIKSQGQIIRAVTLTVTIVEGEIINITEE